MENDYYEKLRLFLQNNLPVHIKTKKDSWINGHVLEVGSVFCIINEFKLGRLLVFFDEIYELESYKKEGDDGTT